MLLIGAQLAFGLIAGLQPVGQIPEPDPALCKTPQMSSEVYRLGRSQGYPDNEIREAYDSEPCDTLAFLRARSTPKFQPPGKQTVTIHVGDTHGWNKKGTFSLPGTPSTATTNCSTLGDYTDCSTTINHGEPARTLTTSTHQVEMRVFMPDGSRATLWCQQKLRYCAELSPGAYAAEIDRGAVWVYVPYYVGSARYSPDGHEQPREVKLHRTKYHIVD